jgi:hypothetical protein
MTKALIMAERFDVLNRPVVHWRIRTEGERSITQQSKDELKFEHRMAQLKRVRSKIQTAIGNGRATQANLVAFSERVLDHDLRLHPDKETELRELARID